MYSHPLHRLPFLLALAFTVTSGGWLSAADAQWVVYEGQSGPGEGKHIVLVSGDEEYRSEQTLPQLGRILATHHGFRATVLFAIDPETGAIDPNRNDNIPGLEYLASADLMVIFTRFRNLPAEQMKHVVDYVESGRPIVGLRTATHAFNLSGGPYASYSWQSKEWDGGFGRQVLGETWVAHHGAHGRQSTRGIIVPEERHHPILRGIEDGDIWGPTDVYAVRLPLPAGCEPLVLGQVVDGMQVDDPPAAGEKNDPMMPVAWTNSFETDNGARSRVFTSTMGAADDFGSEGLRRLLVNACYWCLEMEEQIAADSTVDLVGAYEPLPFGFKGFKPGVKPADLALPTQ